MVEIQVRNPVALWHEIKELIDVHCGVSEDTPFMKEYPEVYHIYQMLKGPTEGEERSAS